MEREPENDERTQEVDWESRKKSDDQQDATPEQLGARGTGGQAKSGSERTSRDGGTDTSRPSESQGDELQQMGNKNPATGTGRKT